MRITKGFGLAILALTAAGMLWISASSRSRDPAPQTVLIKNVRIFDGEKVIPEASVLIEKGKIHAIGKSVSAAPDAEILDGAGKTLLPGLIDSHVHIWSQDNLRQVLVFGVTGLVDMFTAVDFAAEVKKVQAGPGPHLQAYLVSSMTLVTVAGGHGTEYGLKIPTLENAKQAQAFVDARIAEGSDFIKVIYDDGSAYGYHLPTLSLQEVQAVIRAGHARHKLVVVHAGNLKKCIEALQAEADGLAHLNFDNAFDENFGRLAAAHRAFVIPTLTVLQAMNGHPDAAGIARDERLLPFLRPADLQMLKNPPPFKTAPGAYAAAEKAVRQLRQAHVPILAGTDAANPGTAYGPALHGELELLVKAGLTPIEALRAATSVPAQTFGLPGRGRIVPGHVADLLFVDGDPTQNIKATRAIVAVWKDGVLVDRDSYRRGAEKERRDLELQRNAAPPQSLAAGLISDFEGEQISSNFGAGWVVSTDSFMGGKSKAELSLVDGGAEGSKKSLLVKGTVSDAGTIRWAGAMFAPGATVMAPANLSSKKALSFWAKGQGGTFAVMIYSQSLGFIPRIQALALSPEWKEYDFPFEKFGLDGHDIMGILIGASTAPGDFSFQIDNVRLR